MNDVVQLVTLGSEVGVFWVSLIFFLLVLLKKTSHLCFEEKHAKHGNFCDMKAFLMVLVKKFASVKTRHGL